MLPKPHPAQRRILRDKHQTVIVAASRRFGKSLAAMYSYLSTAIDFAKLYPDLTINTLTPTRIAVVAPTIRQVRMLHWEPVVALLNETPALSRLVANINATNMTIDFIGNRPSIVMGGADAGERFRGYKLVKAVVDEVQDIAWDFIDSVLKPALADTPGSQMLAIGTPRGKGVNTLWKLKTLADQFPQQYSFHHYVATDNPHFNLEFLEQERLSKNSIVFAREYLGSFEAFPGQVFDCIGEQCLYDVVPTEFADIIGGLDWGSKNAAYVTVGLANGGFYVLDEYQNHTGVNQASSKFYDLVVQAQYKYQWRHCYADPSRPDCILDLRIAGKGNPGLERCVAGYNEVNAGINQLYNLFELGLLKVKRDSLLHKQLVSYQWQTDNLGQVIEKIADNQNDHLIDALRYAIANKRPEPMLYTALQHCDHDTQQQFWQKRLPHLNPDSPDFDPELALAVKFKQLVFGKDGRLQLSNFGWQVGAQGGLPRQYQQRYDKAVQDYIANNVYGNMGLQDALMKLSPPGSTFDDRVATARGYLLQRFVEQQTHPIGVKANVSQPISV